MKISASADEEDKNKALRQRAERALGQNRVADAVMKIKAIIGPGSIPASESLAQAALDKMNQGREPTPEELSALEIVIRLLRPVVSSRNGVLDDLPEAPGHNLHSQEYKDLWSDFRRKISPLLYSIGRIEFADDGRHVGTGFLVSDHTIATNRHVLGVLTYGSEALAPGKAQIVFKQEVGSTNPASEIVPLSGERTIHRNLDMVLMRISKTPRPFIKVASACASESDRVAAIGYPGEDRANNPAFLAAVFQGQFGVKRAALGEVLDGTESPVLFHDCSTTQGNSGSPIFSLNTGLAVGIHRAGYFMYRNEAVDSDALTEFIKSSG
jgi:S1-C subfamily serine protease